MDMDGKRLNAVAKKNSKTIVMDSFAVATEMYNRGKTSEDDFLLMVVCLAEKMAKLGNIPLCREMLSSCPLDKLDSVKKTDTAKGLIVSLAYYLDNTGKESIDSFLLTRRGIGGLK